MAYATLVRAIPGLGVALLGAIVAFCMHLDAGRRREIRCDEAYERVTAFAACAANEKSSGFCMISPDDIQESRADHEYLMNKCGMISVKVEQL